MSSGHNIFDKLKLKNEQARDNGKCAPLTAEEKIEIIDIDDKVLENTNAFKKDMGEQDESAMMGEEEFYENMKSFKKVDIKSFIQETIDYYSSKQLKQSAATTEGQKENGPNHKKTPPSNHALFDMVTKFTQKGAGHVSHDAHRKPKNEEKSDTKSDLQCDTKRDERGDERGGERGSERGGEKSQLCGQAEEERYKYEGLTPAQRFYEENKEKLIYETMKWYNERGEKMGASEIHSQGDNWGSDRDYYHCYVSDPIVRQKNNFLFDYENEEDSERNVNEEEELELERGVMPTIEQVVCILKHEKVKNIKVIDLNKCGRRDIGMFLILCTGQTAKHNQKVGKLISKIFIDLEIPYISNIVYCYCNKFDDWIISHCGPLKINIVTKELRDTYDIENLFLYPHDHFDSKNFPSFFDYTPGVPPPYLVRSNTSLDAYQNDELYRKFIADA
ncbi:conserved Plasmodium protein, unknown function [Plasmodium ovale]|nr:conserved Plasmodium protein, unknown function [Plasmodium ovale]